MNDGYTVGQWVTWAVTGDVNTPAHQQSEWFAQLTYRVASAIRGYHKQEIKSMAEQEKQESPIK